MEHDGEKLTGKRKERTRLRSWLRDKKGRSSDSSGDVSAWNPDASRVVRHVGSLPEFGSLAFSFLPRGHEQYWRGGMGRIMPGRIQGHAIFGGIKTPARGEPLNPRLRSYSGSEVLSGGTRGTARGPWLLRLQPHRTVMKKRPNGFPERGAHQSRYTYKHLGPDPAGTLEAGWG